MQPFLCGDDAVDNGASGGRTHKVFPPEDFKSSASADSAIAPREVIIHGGEGGRRAATPGLLQRAGGMASFLSRSSDHQHAAGNAGCALARLYLNSEEYCNIKDRSVTSDCA